MIVLTCSMMILAAALFAVFISDTRKAILALWITGLALGSLFLSLGAEFLAVLEWIVSTLVALSFLFYAVMLGEYGVNDVRSWAERIVYGIVALAVGGGFCFMIYLGASHLPGGDISAQIFGFQTEILVGNGESGDLSKLGRLLIEENLLSLETLALMGFLSLVGVGVISRPEREGE